MFARINCTNCDRMSSRMVAADVRRRILARQKLPPRYLSGYGLLRVVLEIHICCGSWSRAPEGHIGSRPARTAWLASSQTSCNVLAQHAHVFVPHNWIGSV